eukprot:s817_g1.t1
MPAKPLGSQSNIMNLEHVAEIADDDEVDDMQKPPAAQDPHLEDYVLQLEKQLSVKAGMLEEALRLHRSFHMRLLTLEEGLSWKDNQLAALAQQFEDVSLKATQASRACSDWKIRAERLEEENCAFRNDLQESREKNQQLRQLLEVREVQAKGAGTAPMSARSRAVSSHGDLAAAVASSAADDGNKATVKKLRDRLSEVMHRNALLEEKLRDCEGVNAPRGASEWARPIEALPELSLWQPTEAAGHKQHRRYRAE